MVTDIKRKLLMLVFIFLCTSLFATNEHFPNKKPCKAAYKIEKKKVSLYNDVLQMNFSLEDNMLSAKTVYNLLDSTQINLSKVSLFAVQLADGSSYSNRDFKIIGKLQIEKILPTDTLPTPALRYPGVRIKVELEHKKLSLKANWAIELRDGSNYIRQQVTFSPETKPIVISKVYVWDGNLPGAFYAGTVLGDPIIYKNFFFGMEHPIAHTPAMRARLAGNLGKSKLDVTALIQEKGEYGVSIEHGGGSDDFNLHSIQLCSGEKIVAEDKHPLNGSGGSNQYLLSIEHYNANAPYSLVLTYRNKEKATGLVHLYHKKNDLLSFYVQRKDTLHIHASLSESGIIGVSSPHQMRRGFQYYIDRERARPYKPFLHYNCWWDITDDGASSFTSEQLIERMHAWYKKLIKPYGIHLYSFVFDDGWDDMEHHVWGFHPEKFPVGFAEQAKLCQQYNSGIGVWMSPFGGYLEAQQQRIKTAKKEGLEVNARGLSLAGKNYYNRFLERSLDMLENYNVNYFKYDGFGGSEPAYLPDMEAGIKLVKRLRKSNPDVYINMTVGSWPSPFWLRYVDCTWRGSGDLHQAGEGEKTQKFMTYRDGTLYNNIVRRSPYYPLNSIMTVGIAYANLGHPKHFISDDLKGFKDMVRSSFAAGSSLQELYISHDKMKPEFWPILAEAIKWSTHRASILKDTHWIGGSPINLEVYGFASWNGKEGVLSLRNPSSKKKKVKIDLQQMMEMSNAENGIYVLKSPWLEDRGKKILKVDSSQPVTLTLNPFECLIFDVVKSKEEKASIRKIEKKLLTYNYSSPREYMEPGRLYPYHRFDGYSRKGKMETWEMIEMENSYIKLWILPAIGGKIWGAVDKKTGKEFLYYNHVVKFRDVSSRGPWTSGGMEMNFGVIGHSPWCSSQVDYVLKENSDGSASCTVGGLDISLGTDWRVEVSLPVDKAYFETKVLWNNGTLGERPFYQWMNAGIKTEGDLQYYYPGANYLTHDGYAMPWPTEKGHRIDKYEENNFGHYKSYHVQGKYTHFWGAYWHKDNFGMAHVSAYDDKLGKKIWIWGLSRFGMLWEDLLTDADGQYTEVQSGKLFNQSIGTSFKTPFKHCSLKPGQVYTWKEHWMPIGNIGGIDFCNDQLAYAWKHSKKELSLQLYAVSTLQQDFSIYSKGKEVFRKTLSLHPTDIKKIVLPTENFSFSDYDIYLGKELLYSSHLNETSLQRPKKLPTDFNHHSAYGLYLQGKEFARQNFLSKAVGYYKQSLQKEPYFSPSLTGLASIYVQRNQLEKALKLVRKALQVNTYDASANFLYARIAVKQHREADAFDGYAVAMQDPTYTGVAAKETAILCFKQGKIKECKRLLQKSLLYNPLNMEALQLSIVIARLEGQKEKAMKQIHSLLKIDPLNYIARYERYLLSRKEADKTSMRKLIINEYWYRTYLSIFSFYERLHRNKEALELLSDLPEHPALLYRKAYLLHRSGNEKQASLCLKQAENGSVSLVYPNEIIDEELYKWVISSGNSSWKGAYYLGLLYLSFDRINEAETLLRGCENRPDFYGFYLTRAKHVTQEEADYRIALELSPDKYVCYTELATFYLKQKRYQKAIDCLMNYRKRDKHNSYVNLLLATSYAKSKKYKAAIRLLTKTKVLPNEGSLEGRNVWRECNLAYAISLIKERKYRKAMSFVNAARQWPENLGVGKPYKDSIDERMEDLLSWFLQKKTGGKSNLFGERIKAFHLNREPKAAMNLFTLLFRQKETVINKQDKQHLFSRDLLKNNAAVRWSSAIYNGNLEQAKNEIDKAIIKNTPLPFEILFDDRDYLIIKEQYWLFEEIINSIKHL